MKITIASEEMQRACNFAAMAIGKKPLFAGFYCLYVRTLPGTCRVEVSACDENNFARMDIPAVSIDEEGEVAVAAANFRDAITLLAPQPITLHAEGKKLRIKYNNGEFSLPLSDETSPTTLSVAGGTGITVNPASFSTELGRVATVKGRDTLRPALGGVCLKTRDGNIDIVASDGVRLMVSRIEDVGDVNCSVVLDGKTVMLMQKLAGADPCEQGTLSWNDDAASFSTACGEVVSKVISARYPNYMSVFPDESTMIGTADVALKDVVAALGRVRAFAPENNNLISLAFENETLTIKAEDVDYSLSAHTTVPCSINKMPPFTIGVHIEAFLGVLKAYHADTLRMGFVDSSRPITLRDADGEDKAVSIVMPMALGA